MALFKTFRGRRTDLDNVAKVDGHAYFCMDDGTFWIDYKDLDEVKRKQINKDDWNEDIKNAVAALKAEIEAELASKTDYLGVVSSIEELSTIAGNGDYHRVANDFAFGDDVAHTGDILIALINFPAQNPECWDLIHIGESIQVDWNQNDETASDYIKNRPCYEEIIEGVQEIVICDANNIEEITDTSNNSALFNSFAMLAPLNSIDVAAGDIIIMTFNSKIYENLKLESVGNELRAGNQSFADPALPDTGEDFLLSIVIGDDKESSFCGVASTLTVDEYDWSDFSVSTTKSSFQIQVKKLDAKYLPDGLATEEYVSNAIDEIEMPTNYITTDTDQTGLIGSKTWESGDKTFKLDPLQDLTFTSEEKSFVDDGSSYNPELVMNRKDTNIISLDFNEKALKFENELWDRDKSNLNIKGITQFKNGAIEYNYNQIENEEESKNETMKINTSGFIAASNSLFDNSSIKLTDDVLSCVHNENDSNLVKKFNIDYSGISYEYRYMDDEYWSGKLLFPTEGGEGTIATREWVEENIELNEDDILIFDGGDADVTLAVLDDTELE